MPSRLICTLLLSTIALAPALPHAQVPSALRGRALAIHRSVPLIDGHNDYPWALREKSPGRDLDVLDLLKPQPSLMTDIARLRAGGVGGQFWSVYVPASMQGKDAVRVTLEQIDVVRRMAAKYADTFELTRTARAVERAFKAGRIGSMMGVEGGHSIDSSLAALRMLHALGADYMTLTHSRNVPWADSATDTPASGGLSAFGEEVVREMNRLGMLVDLSHTSAETMADAIRVSRAPIIFSHSSARAVCAHPRNVPDEILTELPANGGVVMVTFVPGFIAPDAGKAYPETVAMYRKVEAEFPNDPAKARAALAEWRKTHPEPKATLSMVADHIDHIRKVAGIDHIGLGGDFDGIDTVIEGLEDVSKYPDLTAELLRRGYSDDDIRKIIGLNVLRVMRKAEAVAASMKATPPSVAVIDPAK
jgi:membrane dipeptidase